MSGGSMEYLCFKVQEYADNAHDPEITELMNDLAKVLHDMEWWEDSDINEAQYRETVQKFKEKWFKTSREERLRGYIDKELTATKDRLYQMIGVTDI